MNKKFIIILCFETGKVYVSQYHHEIFDDASECFESLNELHDLDLTENNCHYMIVDELAINFI